MTPVHSALSGVKGFLGRQKRKLAVALAVLAVAPIVHGAICVGTPMAPPRVNLPTDAPRVGAGIREVFLEGTPERIGASHARLLRDRMLADEQELWDGFEHFVPSALF